MADTNLYTAVKPTTASASTAIGATSMTVAAVQDRLGNTLTMADFGTKGRGVISSGKTKEEQFTFTGISGTTISGISWVTMKAPYTETSGFAKAHAAGERVILSTNGPEFYDTFLNKANDETITGVHTFSASPIVPTGGTGTQAANATDIANAITAVSGTATNVAYGTVRLSVAAVSGPDPIAVGDNDTRVPTTGQTALLAAITASSAELNILDGYTGTTADLNEMSAIVQATDVSGAELQTLTGGTSSNASALHKHSSSFKLLTYDSSTASGTSTIAHGLGVTPRIIKITAYWALGAMVKSWSIGSYDGTTTQSNTIDLSGSATETSSAYATKVGRLDTANYQTATVAYDGTNVTLTWTKTGTPTGNAQLFVESYA